MKNLTKVLAMSMKIMGHLSASIRQFTQNLKDSGHNFPTMRQSERLMTMYKALKKHKKCTDKWIPNIF